jgi:hypothetical protein
VQLVQLAIAWVWAGTDQGAVPGFQGCREGRMAVGDGAPQS